MPSDFGKYKLSNYFVTVLTYKYSILARYIFAPYVARK